VWSQGRRGETLEEENAMRGSAGRSRVTPPCRERTLRVRKPLKSSPARDRPGRRSRRSIERQEGKVTPRGVPATGEGKPLKAKAQGRYRHETRPERLQAEQSVKRLRKPEGAAQPGPVSPVQVAACFCKRRRAQNPMEDGHHPCGRLLVTASGSGWQHLSSATSKNWRTAQPADLSTPDAVPLRCPCRGSPRTRRRL